MFFPTIEGNYIAASIELPPGADLQTSETIAAEVEAAGLQIASSLDRSGQVDGALITGVYRLVGGLAGGGRNPNGALVIPSKREAVVILELTDPAKRTFGGQYFADQWRDAITHLSSTAQITITARLVTLGAAVQVEVAAEDDQTLMAAVDQMQTALGDINGVFDISSDLSDGNREITLELKPQGSAVWTVP